MAEDYTNQYNTSIPLSKQAAFNHWVITQGAKTGRNPLRDKFDYDVQGVWLSGANNSNDPRQHWPDTYKKPNHPTFSNESIYHGVNGNYGGTWGGDDKNPTYTPSFTNLQHYSTPQLQQYFKQVEPDSTLKQPSIDSIGNAGTTPSINMQSEPLTKLFLSLVGAR